MGAQFQALKMQKKHKAKGTLLAAQYLKAKGYSLKSAMYILTGKVL